MSETRNTSQNNEPDHQPDVYLIAKMMGAMNLGLSIVAGAEELSGVLEAAAP